ncbi:MAG: hypothetical protein OI74_08225 [Gammaproteobacteria bacterium (ex Lamellibrachia satsuma)]|nr:MAG: hypothetical protein HPY30_10920 [Gammaproteobacteria bacterium (ex Lamellibrachia satsuma)]RRS33375.1 MAG: hypothetical protein OI74_08225 [Gammaproteobacteria bacterium (ex Lamellibrachia satsuma)]RRS36694.1 MAG: hypothetical protein NV67_05705 [Gammaproteobacteria bacterium (ex Lamellibrachia satsuma)]
MSKREKKPFRWGRYLLLAVLILTLAVVFFAYRASENQPLVIESQQLNTDAAVRVKKLAQEIRHKIQSDDEIASITITQKDINGLIALATRGIGRLHGHANITPWEAQGSFSLFIPENPFGDYLNLQIGVAPSEYGLRLSQVSVGNLKIPGGIAMGFVESALNQFMGEALGSRFIEAVQSVKTEGDKISVTFKPIPDIKARLKTAAHRVAEVRDNLKLLGDPKRVRAYYSRLCELDRLYSHDLKISAIQYIAPTFELVHKRTQLGMSARKENRAALLAIGIFLGSSRFEPLIGDIRSVTKESCRDEPPNVVLGGRHDLVRHVFVSSTLKLITDSGMSFALGEYKEILDADNLGSGFSFSDLAADQVGIKLTDQLLTSKESARHAQSVLSKATDEQAFFPSIEGLQDGIPHTRFEAEYGSLDDPRYHAMLEMIGKRIEALPVYSKPL